jgi:predicted GIY-YIG superfamily endonuclease
MRTSVYWIRHKDHTDMFSQGYIGISKNIEKRFEQHFKRTKNRHLKFAIEKYGEENLIKQQILVADESYCLDIELKLRPNKDIGWNCTLGGGKPPVALKGRKHSVPSWNKGMPLTDETKKKISNKVSNLWENTEYRQSMSDAHKGQVSPMLGKKHTQETIEKIRAVHKGNTYRRGAKHSQETIEKQKQLALAQKWVCPHCSKIGLAKGAGIRWHFDNCRDKEQQCL